jgi:RNA polymerase sigma-70 factor, ECF subfamily
MPKATDGASLEHWFLTMYEKEADTLFRFCAFKLRDREAALDVVQDTFARVWDYVARGHEIVNFRAFAFRVARNCIVDHVKKGRPILASELGEAAERLLDPAGEADQEEVAELARVFSCMEGLSEEDRELVMLRYTEGVPVKDIAAEYGQKANTVTQRLKRAIELLRECVGIVPKRKSA